LRRHHLCFNLIEAMGTGVASKTIGILTSGGDCPGLNAVIRAAAVHAIRNHGWRVLGVHESTLGLIARPVRVTELTLDRLGASMMRAGGTILGTTNKGDPFDFPMPDGTRKDRVDEVIEGYGMAGLDALIVVGGDGSFSIVHRIVERAHGAMKVVAVPKTIDNDVAETENAIGFSTAVGVVTDALDRLEPTAASHSRVMVLEVMGRDSGHIALASGIAGGADVILIPEIPYDLKAIAGHIAAVKREEGRNHALVIVAEGVKDEDGHPVGIPDSLGRTRYGGIGEYMAEHLAPLTGAETRVTVLGHVQRGGQPDWDDRILGSAFGVHAVDLIAEGKFDRMLTWQNRRVIDVPLADAIARPQLVDLEGSLVRTARGLGICLGDS
jgi:ATP-dependent phosphofructokinase / diphosphate-dependent phosphofructokinase